MPISAIIQIWKQSRLPFKAIYHGKYLLMEFQFSPSGLLEGKWSNCNYQVIEIYSDGSYGIGNIAIPGLCEMIYDFTQPELHLSVEEIEMLLIEYFELQLLKEMNE